MKRPKLNEIEWLRNVIFLLKQPENARDGLSLHEVHHMTNTRESEMTESCLFEHPSIRFKKGKLYFEPFVAVSNRPELIHFLNTTYPVGIRRIHLHGLYQYVDVDLDDMLLNKEIHCLDEKMESFVYKLHLDLPTLLTTQMCERYRSLPSKASGKF